MDQLKLDYELRTTYYKTNRDYENSTGKEKKNVWLIIGGE